MGNSGEPGVWVVASIQADDSALCAFVRIGGAIFAAVNCRYQERAVEHIREHAARGFLGQRVCSVDCTA